MSDGLSAVARAERNYKEFRSNLSKLDNVLEEMHDSIFGLPLDVVEEVKSLIKKYNII